MRIFVAGATGAVGMRLLPLLVARGHQVVGTTRSPDHAKRIEKTGAVASVTDGLDREDVLEAVRDARPEVVVHQMTALAGEMDLRKFDRVFAQTNRLRTEGLDHLLEAATETGARRVVVQSFCGWPYARTGSMVKSEEDALDPAPPAEFRRTLDAIRHLEHETTESTIEGLVLRYGVFYGPDTGVLAASNLEAVRRRRFPLIGEAGGWWSFVHVDDAAEATALAIEQGAPGLYNIVDDDPAPVREWLPALAGLLGAQPPRRLPAWLGRLLAGEAVTTMMTQVRAGSNDKAERELHWRPRHTSWREGFASVLGPRPVS